MKKIIVIIFCLFICSISLTSAQNDVRIANTIWYGFNAEYARHSGLTIINFLSEKECEVTFIQEEKGSTIFKYSYTMEKDSIHLTPPEGADYYPGLCYITKKGKEIKYLKYCTLFPEETISIVITSNKEPKKALLVSSNNLQILHEVPREKSVFGGKEDFVKYENTNSNLNFPKKK